MDYNYIDFNSNISGIPMNDLNNVSHIPSLLNHNPFPFLFF